MNPTLALNGICPYFTMFPLDFPMGVLRRVARPDDVVLDPFCGRGTTLFAARVLGLRSLGVDASPVAAAITASKLATTTVDAILQEARKILKERTAHHVPSGEFWTWAFHPDVLEALCQFREAFLEDCSTDARVALRGIILGALHGPKQKRFPGYFSNQCPRTYAPKPAYATRFWQSRRIKPDPVDVLALIERRARRYFTTLYPATGTVRCADSRVLASLRPDDPRTRFNIVITSPPYYGMRSYIADQWLRHWFVGGPDVVDYAHNGQITHSSPAHFAEDLRKIWRNVAHVCADDATLVVRFGGIPSKQFDPLEIIKASMSHSGWDITTIQPSGTASDGRRQSDTFLKDRSNPMVEYDLWACRH